MVRASAIAGLVLVFSVPACADITIPTVPIGSPGNAADSTGFGSVAYSYNIGTSEVTNEQYAAFLNAVAANDTHALYNINMASTYGGITRTGSPGSYSYATIPGRENNPVNYVSFWDAARFANWLHNGQPTGPQNNGSTENGAYTLNFSDTSSNNVTRNSNWRWAVTSTDEWYKAAFFQPFSQGGDIDDYWLYPNSANTISTLQANYLVVGDTTPAGTYAANFYGALDMGGNVDEWNEDILFGSLRSIRGGSYASSLDVSLRATSSSGSSPTSEYSFIGFRVSQVPSPSGAGLLTACALLSARRRRG